MSRPAASAPLLVLSLVVVGCGPVADDQRTATEEEEVVVTEPGPLTVRVATFNIEDLRTEEVSDPDSPRARAAAAVIQRIGPDVVLVNELAYDQPGGAGWREGRGEGRNGQLFADNFLAISQGEGLEPRRYRALMLPTNTGIASGHDLDNDGSVGSEPPELPEATDDPETRRQTPEGRAYGADTWGFGTFPGQYGMALLVRHNFDILEDRIRTFRLLPWSAMPGALVPIDPATGEPWYSPDEWAAFRLSSKSHWDVPVRMPNGAVVHFLVSHPTPPAFDGPEERNRKRNHDEIRFWADYLDGAEYIVDDRGRRGGLDREALFVILGDLNADPAKGRSLDDPIGTYLLAHERIQAEPTPTAREPGIDPEWTELDPADTSEWGMRVDYVLPSRGLEIRASAVERPGAEDTQVSDHFPVWVDLIVQPK
jgi:endonuclease/exonuclease/phosphatase family metal-dependent hydrolase